MAEIITAEEYCRKNQNSNHPDMINHMMIEFAKLHVEAALKAASENITDNYTAFLYSNDILNCYPLNNIK